MITIIEIFAIIGLVLTLANAIAKLTPSTKDDTFVEKARFWFEKVSNLFLPDLKAKK